MRIRMRTVLGTTRREVCTLAVRREDVELCLCSPVAAAVDKVGKKTDPTIDKVGNKSGAAADKVGKKSDAAAGKVGNKSDAAADKVGNKSNAAAGKVGNKSRWRQRCRQCACLALSSVTLTCFCLFVVAALQREKFLRGLRGIAKTIPIMTPRLSPKKEKRKKEDGGGAGHHPYRRMSLIC